MIEKDDRYWVSKCCLKGTRHLYGSENNPPTGIRWGAMAMQHLADYLFCPWCGAELPKEVPCAQAL